MMWICAEGLGLVYHQFGCIFRVQCAELFCARSSATETVLLQLLHCKQCM